MHVIHAANVNDGLAQCLFQLEQVGERRETRNGPVIAFPGPVTTTYSSPTERVLFSPMRNANPAFHLLESLWMLSGRNDVAFPATLVKNMKSFTDDGKTFHGAYGHRWRNHFGYDQLKVIRDELWRNPDSRRMVLGMWNPGEFPAGRDSREFPGASDLMVASGTGAGLDVPCNTQIYFDCRGGKLNMLVCCRSNDIIWGCYGANAVHMSMLQEYMAAWIGIPVGQYHQMSNDLHLYLAKMPDKGLPALQKDVRVNNLYELPNPYGMKVSPLPLLHKGEEIKDFDDDVSEFFAAFDSREGIHAIPMTQFETRFFQTVVVPMTSAWLFRKTATRALEEAGRIRAQDWSWAMQQWIRTNHVSFGGAK